MLQGGEYVPAMLVLLGGETDCKGRVEITARYLGPYFHARGRLHKELRRRIMAARAAFYSMAPFWWVRGYFKLKRAVRSRKFR